MRWIVETQTDERTTNEMGENLTGPRQSERKGDEAKSYYTFLYADIQRA